MEPLGRFLRLSGEGAESPGEAHALPGNSRDAPGWENMGRLFFMCDPDRSPSGTRAFNDVRRNASPLAPRNAAVRLRAMRASCLQFRNHQARREGRATFQVAGATHPASSSSNAGCVLIAPGMVAPASARALSRMRLPKNFLFLSKIILPTNYPFILLPTRALTCSEFKKPLFPFSEAATPFFLSSRFSHLAAFREPV